MGSVFPTGPGCFGCHGKRKRQKIKKSVRGQIFLYSSESLFIGHNIKDLEKRDLLFELLCQTLAALNRHFAHI